MGINMGKIVGNGTVDSNTDGSRNVSGNNNSGSTSYFFTQTGTGHYEGSDTNGNSYGADKIDDGTGWSVVKTTPEGEELQGDFTVNSHYNGEVIIVKDRDGDAFQPIA